MIKRVVGLVLPAAFITVLATPALADGGWGHGGWGHGCCWGGHSHNSFSLSLAFGFPSYPSYPAYPAYYPAPYYAYPAPVYYAPPVVYAPPPAVYAPPVAYAAPTVSAVPTRDFRDTAGRYCREYQRTAVIGGQQQQVYGTACQMPDGAWRIVNEQQ